jgi:ParB family chromosome partitioning protein
MELSNLNPTLLQPNPWNSNKVQRKEFDKLKLSLQNYGAFKPIVVRTLADGTLQIVGGYHRNEAAKELGWSSVPVVNLGELSEAKAKEIGLIDNTRYGEDDQELLDTILAEIDDLDAFEAMMPEDTLVDMLEEDPLIGEVEELAKDREEKPETHKTLKFKLETDKAEEIEAILSVIAYDHDYKYSDGHSNFGDALYHALVLGKLA